jgi:DNA-binding PadR family transcriptional regulator
MTGSQERVLRVFLDDPTAPRYGYDLMKAAALPSGTLYPMLARLETAAAVLPADR